MNARFFLLLSWLLPWLAGAAPAPADNWQRDAALSKLMLRALVETPDGLLWVGADDGVYRYDGTELVALNALRRGGQALPVVPCDYLLPLPDGQLWLGTEAGLFSFGVDGRLRALPLPAPDNSNHAVEALTLALDGRIWVKQRQVGLQAYSAAGRPTGPLLPLATGELSEAWPAPDGSLWVTDEHGTRQFGSSGQLLGQWHLHPAHSLCPVYDPQGRPWLLSAAAAYRPGPGGTLREVVRWASRAQENGASIVRYSTGPALLWREQIRQLAWSPGADPQLKLRFAVALPPWPTAYWRGKLQADRTGRWLVFDTGTRGCWYREAAPVFIRALPGPGGRPYSVRSSVRLPDGRLLVSSYEAGFLTQARDSPLAPLRRWAAAQLPTGSVPVLMGIVPAPVGPGGDWLAAGAFPFLRFNPRTGQLAELVAADQRQAAIGISQLLRDPATGLVWAGTRLGLYCYDAGLQTFRPFVPPGWLAGRRPPLAGRVVEDVCPAGAGALWLATPEGVERLNLTTGACTSYNPAAPPPRRAALDGARCLHLAADGRLWVGTRAHGLAVVEPTGRARTVLNLGQGLPNASVATMLPSPGGYLWLGTYQGLVRYQPGTGQLAVFTTAQGMASDECNARAAYADPADHSLLIGGVGGLHRVYPGQMPGPSPERPQLHLTSLAALSASAEDSRPRYLLAGEALPPLHLAPDQPLIDLHLALTGSPDASRARYAYRVRGYLADRWLGLGTAPQLRLQGLPPGDYTVEVRGETSQGTPATNVLRLPLTVTIAWYNRPLTWVLAGLLAALATGLGVYAWQRGRLRQLQREAALRTHLAADLHDEVGSLLTRINFQAQLLRDQHQHPRPADAGLDQGFERLLTNSAAAVQTMRDVVWSIDARADSAGALLDRMRDYLDQLGEFAGPALTLQVAGLPDELPLAPALRQQLYLMFKEAITNALRHARAATAIAVSLTRAEDALELEIVDDGTYRAGASRPSGLGLRNLAQRARALGGELQTGVRPDGQPGFRVWVRVPTGR